MTIRLNNQLLEIQMFDVKAIALITINQGLISGAHTPKGNSDQLGAGTIIHILKKHPSKLKINGNNHQNRQFSNKLKFEMKQEVFANKRLR